MGTRQYVWWNSLWCVVVGAALVLEVAALNGPHVCMVQQKYNITKRVKYRAPMSVRTYEWCFSMPPRCSKWKTEMRELTKLETDERIAEVAVCCPGYKMKDVSCVPICPNGKTGHHCSEACPPTKWGPNCVHACDPCVHGACDPTTGECSCHHGWQGESCESRMPPPTTVAVEDLLTKATKTTTAYTSTILPSTTPIVPSPTSTTILTSPSTISPANIYSSATNSSTNSTVSTPITSTAVSIISTTLPTSKPTSKITTTLATTESTSTITTEASTSPKPLTESTTVTSTSIISTTILNSSPTETEKANTTIVATSPTTISHGTTTVISITEPVQTTHVNNVTLTFPTIVTTEMSRRIEESTKETVAKTMYNHTEKPQEKKTVKDIFVEVKTIPDSRSKPYETTKVVQTKTTYSNLSYNTETTIFTTEKSLKEVTKRPEATFRYFPTTVKFKPKEIWIRPAQKEPEHITAVMEGKGKEQSSLDLVSVISIAVGVMMIIITVAVIIVMLERCRKPRYDDVRKINDIHMQVMIDNNDVPPPYVRSIFHTPLPAPPTSEKCHYQPISTLDRNLKQFMRPVVVQTISPIMLENFRGILECHYDHLPRRSYNFEASPRHCSVMPSMDGVDELACLRPCSVADSTIEALKCEAKMDVIDHTTNEPLYAEIPCWRPPSEHAIEIMNMNGEAVTEL